MPTNQPPYNHPVASIVRCLSWVRSTVASIDDLPDQLEASIRRQQLLGHGSAQLSMWFQFLKKHPPDSFDVLFRWWTERLLGPGQLCGAIDTLLHTDMMQEIASLSGATNPAEAPFRYEFCYEIGIFELLSMADIEIYDTFLDDLLDSSKRLETCQSCAEFDAAITQKALAFLVPFEDKMPPIDPESYPDEGRPEDYRPPDDGAGVPRNPRLPVRSAGCAMVIPKEER